MNLKCPSRNSWFRALLLIFSRVVVILLLATLLESLPKGAIRTLVSIAGWIGFSVLMGVWRHLFAVFKKETRFWKIQAKSVVEVVNALKISLLSDLITIGSGLFFFFSLSYAFKLNEKDEILLALTMCLMFVIWFFSMPVLYERTLVKRKSKAKPNKKET